jgi:hypothetical protein
MDAINSDQTCDDREPTVDGSYGGGSLRVTWALHALVEVDPKGRREILDGFTLLEFEM